MWRKGGIAMTPRENTLRAIRFETPDWIPMSFHINGACWHHYDPSALQDLMEAHPFLFPKFVRRETVTPTHLANQRKDVPYTDPWGCVWQTCEDGITGSVHGHPLGDWAAFDRFVPPDPGVTDGTYPVDWGALRHRVRQHKTEGRLVQGGLPHGHTFLRLQDIRGYEKLLFDMLDGEPRLLRLIEQVADFNAEYVHAGWR